MKTFLESGANGLMYIFTLAETNEYFKFVELILSILMTLFIIVVNVVSWYKKAKKDGKIDEEEIEELKNIVEDGKEKIDNIKK